MRLLHQLLEAAAVHKGLLSVQVKRDAGAPLLMCCYVMCNQNTIVLHAHTTITKPFFSS